MKETIFDMPVASDSALIEKILQGEIALFEVLIRRYNQLLYKTARSYGLSHEDAQDTMQESHFAAYTQLSKFRNEASYKTWLMRIHLHKCYHKTHYGAARFEQPHTENMEEKNADQKINREETGRVIVNRELSRLLEESLQKLPLSYRSVFVLREIEGFSVAETSELLHISPINVKVRLNRAKTMLRERLEKFYSSSELYEFNEIYCDAIVHGVFNRIHKNTDPSWK